MGVNSYLNVLLFATVIPRPTKAVGQFHSAQSIDIEKEKPCKKTTQLRRNLSDLFMEKESFNVLSGCDRLN